ncbi:MAG TPA: BrnA antitoxin family protein [Caulobacteraceae bacterium]|jgi:uncharacterized protein (DUF4415 family)|nr:BrnA antitoxin family protein [Caulobacteraceae bacterium]
MEKRLAAAPEPDLTDPDNPEWTDEDFARALGPESLSPAELAAFPRTKVRGPQRAPTKKLVSLRLDPEILQHFKAGGPGWQSRINATLQDAIARKR